MNTMHVRFSFIVLAAIVAVPALAAPTKPLAAEDTATAIRTFRIKVPDAALVDLRRRVVATRWPDGETVADRSQGVQLAKIQKLVRYWGTDYDWRKVEATLNALPQFVTTIDGLDIHFIYIRSRHPNALPLIITHGWPGSILELVKVIGPLTDPTAHGGRAEDAFDVIIPSMPGYGYVSQGGDWGSVVSDVMARQAPPGFLGIHVNMPATVPPDIAKALSNGDPAPAGLSAEEKDAFDQLDSLYKKGSGYAAMMVTRPQTLGYSLSDSPAGLAAWFYDKFADWTYSGGDPERSLTRDEMLDDITPYWLTNTGTSSYHKLIYFRAVDKGGHFAAWEQPELLAAEMRAAFKSLR
jgi:pimeloyl-ACP methyl ester carboxylesterase